MEKYTDELIEKVESYFGIIFKIGRNDMRNKYEGKWGLVFAGGGGKGAYEIGVWKALNEYSKLPICAVSGTSVGALNAVLYASGKYKMAEEIWSHITKDKILTQKSIYEVITSKAFLRFVCILLLKKSTLPTSSNIFNPTTSRKPVINSIITSFDPMPAKIIKSSGPISEYLRLYYDTGVFSRSGLEEIIKEYKVLDYFMSESIPCFATCYNADRKESKSFCLNDYDKNIIKKIILASSAIPVVFDPVTIDGCKFCDGGLADNVPIKPLYDLGIRKFLVIHLDNNSSFLKNLNIYLDSEVIDVYPQKDLGNFFDGIMDFDPCNAKKRMKWGYDDMICILKDRFWEYKTNKNVGSQTKKCTNKKTFSQSEIYHQIDGKNLA